MIVFKSHSPRLYILALFFVCAAFVVSCSLSENHDLPPPVTEAKAEETRAPTAATTPVVSSSYDDPYRLGADDLIRINVYGESELSDAYKVSPDGVISMPLIGSLKVGGLTIAETGQLVTQKLADGYLVDPNVSIEVVQSRAFYVLGEVRNPGGYAYAGDLSVLKAAALAGGFTSDADEKEARISRAVNGKSLPYEVVAVESAVMPGDIVMIRKRFK